MIVLGLCAFTHDSAAALLVDGKLIGFAEEERLNGVKHTNVYPERAVAWLLGQAGVSAGQVDTVAYNFHPALYRTAVRQLPGQLARPQTAVRAAPRAASFAKVARRTGERLIRLGERFPRAAIRPVQHHRAHAWTALLSSGYDDAGVLIVDSLGELQTTTVWQADTSLAQPLRLRAELSDPASLGYAYGAITEHLGWRRGDEEGTVMALAALGNPARFREVLNRAIPLTPSGFELDPGLLPLRVLSARYGRASKAFMKLTCPPRAAGDAIEEVHADLAAALQERTERVMTHCAAYARRLTGSRLLCVGGGVAMNCVSIGAIIRAGFCDEVHVPAAPGDSGTAIGAAADAWHAATGRLPSGADRRCYLGPDHHGWRPTRQQLTGLHAHRPPSPALYLAQQLATGKIVGLFHGPLEAGPRALGHRSILASPLIPDVVERLNATVKFREPFRPFAPVVLADRAADYFQLTQPSPFMSIAVPATDLARQKLGAIVHGNGTARVQTVHARTDLFMTSVLKAFGELTGHPVLINTSLNVKGKPICGTPELALDCLTESGLDALLIEGTWVSK
jgi:carbamoyltransferase